MLLQQLKLECRRIFGDKRNIIFFVIFIAIGIFFVYSGGVAYKNFLKEKEFFITHETNKVSLYVTYSHYGDYGFRVLCEASPLSIFFYNSVVFENLYSNIDMTEILDVNRSYKGRNLLLKKGFFKDLAGIFFLFGSLFMVYMGMTSYKSEKYFFRFGNIIIRLGILNMLFMLVLFILYHFPKIFHFHFSVHQGKIFFYFALYILLFLDFFYGAGLFIRVLSRKKQATTIYVFIFWFLSIAIIPEAMNIFLQKKSHLLPANEEHNITKLEEVMNFERKVQKAIAGVNSLKRRNEICQEMAKDFLDTGYIKNSEIEKAINRHIQKVVREYEKALLIYPTSFYNYLSGEISAKGYHGYLGLVKYTLTLRHHFIKYYLKKRYESKDKTIVSFIKNDENIYYTTSYLPQSFPIASGLTFLYTIIIFTVSYVVLKRRIGRMPKIEKPMYQFRKGNTYFVLCKNNRYRDNLFRCYQADANTVGIDNVKAEEVDPGVGLAQILTYFCKFSGVDEKKAMENLRLLGVEDIKAKTRRSRKQKEEEEIPDEVILKIYCAVTTAGTHEIVVVKDFLKGKSREMERLFLNLITRLNAAAKIVVYLSSEIFLTSLPFEGNIKIENYKSFKIDPQAVSLR
ncbi:MAG: ABC transporter permease [Candidatus Aminicenantes bacterium]|nr:MAG: ABC transporter permease [Candidatus Aminicenantes bacterium]